MKKHYFFGIFLCFVVELFFVACGVGLSGLTIDQKATCTLESVAAGGNCGCDLLLPINPALLTGPSLIWPFGVHGGGHPEGHHGWDFLSNIGQDIIAPADGVLVKLDDGVKDEDPLGQGVYLKLRCGIIVSFQPMRLDASLSLGSFVRRGNKIGVTSPVVFGGYSTHFDTRVLAANPPDGVICSTPFFSSDKVALVTALIAPATYPEKVGHTVNVGCDNGSTSSITFPAENILCNARASAANTALLSACLPSKISTGGIW
jgi:hypothetical protein